MPPSPSSPPLCAPSRRARARRSASEWLVALLGGTLGAACAARADELFCPAPLSPCTLEGGVLCPTVEPRPPPTVLRETRPDPNAAVSSTSDHASDTFTQTGLQLLQGHVVVHQGDRQVRADNIQYDRANNQLSAQGSVVYEDPIVQLSGSQGHYSATKGADVENAQFALKQRPAHGTAESLALSPDGVLTMRGVVFTTCPLTATAWALRAGSLTLDTNERIGSGRDARVDFEGVPILYLPWLSFPLSDERKSGFLFPSIGNSTTSGVQLEVPYYFNIAPNADLTFVPIYYSLRGVDASGDTRWLTSDQNGELTWHWLPDDRADHGNDRSFLALREVAQLPDEWRLNIQAENVSDTMYFSNFGSGPESTSTPFLQRIAQLTYRDEYWTLGAQAQQYQTIDLSLPDQYRPYARAPWMYADGDFGWGPNQLVRYGVNSELVNFLMPIGPTGWRLDLAPHVALDYEDPGYFARTQLTWRYTRYALEDPYPAQPSSPTRTLPTASFDTGLLFDGPAGGGDSRTLTLEPRAQYVYTPYRNQNDLPLFDTDIPDPNMVELFRTNRFVGADRVSDANQVTFGMTSRLVNATTGQQYLAATLGGIYYLQTPRVADVYSSSDFPLPADEATPSSLAAQQTSEVIAEIVLSAYRNWNVALNLAYDPSTQQEQRTFVQLQYKPAGESVINVAYRYQRSVAVAPPLLPGVDPAAIAPNVINERLNQAEVSGAWPVTRNWHVLARAVYDFEANQSLDKFAGFEYTSCCWRVRLLARRYLINGTGTQNTAVLFQIQLGGLAGVGPATDTFLGSAIQGYSPPTLSRSTARSSLGNVSLFPP